MLSAIILSAFYAERHFTSVILPIVIVLSVRMKSVFLYLLCVIFQRFLYIDILLMFYDIFSHMCDAL